jgi:hypothetical protein
MCHLFQNEGFNNWRKDSQLILLITKQLIKPLVSSTILFEMSASSCNTHAEPLTDREVFLQFCSCIKIEAVFLI